MLWLYCNQLTYQFINMKCYIAYPPNDSKEDPVYITEDTYWDYDEAGWRILLLDDFTDEELARGTLPKYNLVD